MGKPKKSKRKSSNGSSNPRPKIARKKIEAELRKLGTNQIVFSVLVDVINALFDWRSFVNAIVQSKGFEIISRDDLKEMERSRTESVADKPTLDGLIGKIKDGEVRMIERKVVDGTTGDEEAAFELRFDPPPWTPLKRIEIPKDYKKTGNYDGAERFVNSRYHVIARPAGQFVHLSIARHDKSTVRSWRDLQRIKNEIVGRNAEGVELFPDEARLIDTSNQYHLFVLPKGRFPFGDEIRMVSEETILGAAQEPFEDDNKPDDLQSREELGQSLMDAGVTKDGSENEEADTEAADTTAGES